MGNEEFKTLLRIEGDASGAKAAAQETADSLAKAGESAKSAESAIGTAADEGGKALADQGQKARESGKGLGEVAGKAGEASEGLHQLVFTLRRVSPELGEMAHFLLGMGQAGAGFLVIMASVGLLIETIRKLREDTENAKKAFEEMGDAAQRARDKTTSRVESTADAMIRAGVGGDQAINAAVGKQVMLEREGFKGEALQGIMPLAVDESGAAQLTDEEIRDAAAAAEFGGDKFAAMNLGEMKNKDRARRRLRSFLGANRDRIATWRSGIAGRTSRESDRVAQMDSTAIVKRLMRDEPGLSEEEAKAGLEDMRALQSGGGISTEKYNITSNEDRLQWRLRQSQAARRLGSMGLVSPQRERELEGTTQIERELQPLGSVLSWIGSQLKAAVVPDVSGAGSENRGPNAAANWAGRQLRDAVLPDFGQRGLTINAPNHGVIIQAPDSRGVQQRRIASP